jgi:DeoR/GlpR family transcriptional regulator of sugar metabolism
MVSDANKFGSEALVVVCALAGIDRLVTDAAPPSDLAEALDQAQVEVTVAE